jgi:hypothetical protein
MIGWNATATAAIWLTATSNLLMEKRGSGKNANREVTTQSKDRNFGGYESGRAWLQPCREIAAQYPA